MIDVYASRASYWRHLAPVVEELRARGHDVATWTERRAQPWGNRWVDDAGRKADVTLVASWQDAQRFQTSRVVYLEHGAGQTYRDGNRRGWAGADELDHVRLFLGPSEKVGLIWRTRYPQAVVETVGDPALDQHFRRKCNIERGISTPNVARARVSEPAATTSGVAPAVVAVTAHWRCTSCPETWPAVGEYSRAIARLPTTYRVAATGHPKDEPGARGRAKRWRVPYEPDPDVVLATLVASAGVLIADNTSLMYEAAALDVPVLALNGRRWRREVEHGLRFWSHVPGPQVDDPEDFRKQLEAVVEDCAEFRALRARAAGAAYAHLDDGAAARAADAIEGAG